MLLTIKKQVEETVELKTPAYYKDDVNAYHHINEIGQLITVRTSMINIWSPQDGSHYNSAIEEVMRRGEECTKEEFEKAYMETLEKFESAVGIVNNDY